VSGRPDRLRLGDVVRFDGDSHEIVGFDGAAAILSTTADRTSVVTIAAPLGDASFEVLHCPHRRHRFAPAYFEALPANILERALLLRAHVSEVLDGVSAGSAPGSAPGSVPQRQYEVSCTTLRQREFAKIAEPQLLQRPVG
jgi:putative transposase